MQIEDKGKTVCLEAGQELTVFLGVPLEEEAARWGAINASDSSVLEALSSGVLTLPRGVTGAVYLAKKKGVAQLDSVRPPCAGPAAGCSPDRVWHATVVVQ